MLGRGFGFNIGLGLDVGTSTSIQVDTAYTFGTSGEAFFLRFVATEDQTSGNLTVYAYSTATTGSPTFSAEIRNGPGPSDDPDRPEAGGATLATTSGVVPTANTWSAFSFTGVTLVGGQQYYVIIYNAHGTPASNHASWQYRGAMDSHDNSVNILEMFQAGYTSDGFATDPLGVGATQIGSCCLVYNSGNQYGNPYVNRTTHASNANDRGNRIRFVEKIKILGAVDSLTSAAISTYEINQGATNISSVTSDTWSRDRSNFAAYEGVELNKATDYDFVTTFSSSAGVGQIYDMGEAEGSLPADVIACRPGGVVAYVDGTTPGSYAVDTSKMLQQVIFIDDQVSITGGGGNTIIHGSMRGGYVN